MEWENYNIKMEEIIGDNIGTIKNMEQEYLPGLVGKSMIVAGEIVSNMAKAA